MATTVQLLCRVIVIIDFEGVQVGSVFYPLEIAALNVKTMKCLILHISHHLKPQRANDSYTNSTVHTMQWNDDTIPISMAVKRLNEFVQPEDLVVVRGEQRVFQVKAWLPWHEYIQELATPATMQEITAFADATSQLQPPSHTVWCHRR